MTDVYAEYRTKYAELTAKAASLKEATADVQARLDSVNAKIEDLRVEQAALVERKSSILGGQSYLDLKKHLAALAKLLSGK